METAGGRADTLVFLATYNERPNIDGLLDLILGLPIRCDIFAVDDNSPDGTAAALQRRATVDSRIFVLVRPTRLGIGSAHRLAWLYARRHGYARIVTLDADRSHDPLDIPRLLRALDEGADVALGSRFVVDGKLGYTGWRRVLSRSANGLARILLGCQVAEYTNSFRAARLDRVPVGLIETIRNNGYGYFLAATVRMARSGLRLVEVPIHFQDRQSGKSKMPRSEILFGAANLLRLALDRRRFGEANPQPPAACGACGQLYVVTTPPHRTQCLACMTVG